MEPIKDKSKSNPLAWVKAKNTSDIGIKTILKFVFILSEIHEAARKSLIWHVHNIHIRYALGTGLVLIQQLMAKCTQVGLEVSGQNGSF